MVKEVKMSDIMLWSQKVRHLGLQHAQAAQLEVMEEALALEEVARQLRAVLQQPLARAIQLRRKCESRLRICTQVHAIPTFEKQCTSVHLQWDKNEEKYTRTFSQPVSFLVRNQCLDFQEMLSKCRLPRQVHASALRGIMGLRDRLATCA